MLWRDPKKASDKTIIQKNPNCCIIKCKSTINNRGVIKLYKDPATQIPPQTFKFLLQSQSKFL